MEPIAPISLKRRKPNLAYCDFNAATHHDSRAGFISTPTLPPSLHLSHFPSPSLVCVCGSEDLDPVYRLHFGMDVCFACAKKEGYSLLTKTECKADYLLTDPELATLKYWIRPNPHQSSYANMLLYCRMQVEEFAFEKWGGEVGLDKEFEERCAKKTLLLEKKRKKKMIELRTKTRPSLMKALQGEEDHVHVYEDAMRDGATVQVCKCGIQVLFEEF